jgi:hypothetical protein
VGKGKFLERVLAHSHPCHNSTTKLGTGCQSEWDFRKAEGFLVKARRLSEKKDHGIQIKSCQNWTGEARGYKMDSLGSLPKDPVSRNSTNL